MRKGPQILLSSELRSLLGNCFKVLGCLAVKNWSQSQAEGSITISAQQVAEQTFTYRERTKNGNYICKDLKHLRLQHSLKRLITKCIKLCLRKPDYLAFVYLKSLKKILQEIL